MTISKQEAVDFINEWYDARLKGSTLEDRKRFFSPEWQWIVLPNGDRYTLEHHEKMHQKWVSETTDLQNITVTDINDSPERVRVDTTVYWEGVYEDGKKEQSVQMIHYMIERNNDNELKFIFYYIEWIDILPSSSRISWDDD